MTKFYIQKCSQTELREGTIFVECSNKRRGWNLSPLITHVKKKTADDSADGDA